MLLCSAICAWSHAEEREGRPPGGVLRGMVRQGSRCDMLDFLDWVIWAWLQSCHVRESFEQPVAGPGDIASISSQSTAGLHEAEAKVMAAHAGKVRRGLERFSDWLVLFCYRDCFAFLPKCVVDWKNCSVNLRGSW